MQQIIQLSNMIPSWIIWILSIIGFMSILGTTLFLIFIPKMAKPEIVIENKSVKFYDNYNGSVSCYSIDDFRLGKINGIEPQFTCDNEIKIINLDEMKEITYKMIELKEARL